MKHLSMHKACGLVPGAIIGGALAAIVAVPAVAQDQTMVPEMTMERALNPQNEPHNWLLHYGNYAGHRYSTLDEINKDTVGNLRLAFAVGLGGIEGGGRYAHGALEGTPIIEDGFMYVTDGWGSVYKIDVTSGTRGIIVWKMDPGTDKAWSGDVACCGVDNRGVALWRDKVISVTLDGRVISTDKATGEVAWERTVADPGIAETLTVAPLVVNDIAIVGASGAEKGIRGWIDATDLNTGQQAWRTYTIPAPGEPGSETWTDDYDAWETGGGSAWVTGTYDAERNLLYWGTGNPGPDWDAEYRPGDNLYTDAVLALNADTGEIEWWYQYTPNDPYDFDEVGEHPLVDVEIGGEMRQLAVHAGRNGFFYGFDRGTGEFIYGTQYVDEVNWTPGLDPKTGVPLSYDPALEVQTYVPGTAGRRDGTVGTICPSIVGGKNWQPTAYNPDLQLLYIPSIEGCNDIITEAQDHFINKGGTVRQRENFTGGGLEWPVTLTGSIAAMDVTTGEQVAKIPLQYPNYSGILATAGGVVFTGNYDGTLSAYDAETLEELWGFSIGSGFNAPPVTYSVDGKQYIAILSGSRRSRLVVGPNPELEHLAPQSVLYVFAL